MNADLETWLAGERRRRWSLVTHDDGTIDAFDDLARRSEPHVLATGRPFLPRWNPHSAWTPRAPRFDGLPDGLAFEWRRYGVRWSCFMLLNERVWLTWLLGQIAEAHDGSSWPYDSSPAIRAWVRSGYTSEWPFRDLDGVDTPELREHLTRLDSLGWVVWSDIEHRFEWID